jgi:hypothetical protein
MSTVAVWRRFLHVSFAQRVMGTHTDAGRDETFTSHASSGHLDRLSLKLWYPDNFNYFDGGRYDSQYWT